MAKVFLRVLCCAGLAAAILVAAIVADFAFFRGRTPAIAGSAQAVASLERIALNGARQWILVRGRNAQNPVVLFLHGGPGMPVMYLAHDFQRGLEEDFVCVHWDRRGAGKSYQAGLGADLTVRQTLEDALELTRRLRRRFRQQRIYLVGHSWGSMLGMLAVREHPEYYAAYVGTGQMAAAPGAVEVARREFLLARAREQGDGDLAARLGAVRPEIGEDELFRQGGELFRSRSMWPLLWSGLRAREYTFADVLHVKRGAEMVGRRMRQDVLSGPLDECVTALAVPVFFLLGRHDWNTPSTLAAAYLKALRAPRKRLFWFEESAHFPFFEEPRLFRERLRAVEQEAREYWSGGGKAAPGNRPGEGV